MVITHNLNAINANRILGMVSTQGAKKMEKLSSGYRINRAADDAAGLAISEKMRRQIRGLTRASLNAQDGISLVQSAEGALNEMHEIVHRGNELAVKAANGTLSNEDRALVDTEIQQLKEALNETAQNTVFNEVKLFPLGGESPKDAVGASQHYEIEYQITNNAFTIVSYADSTQSPAEGEGATNQVLADKIATELVPNAVKQIFDAFPSLKDAMGSDTVNMTLDISNIDGASGTLAYAQCSFYGTGEPFNFLIKVDSSDFSDADVSGTGTNAEMLESTIAHELMHSVMQYTLTDEMTGRVGEEFPEWFVEGTAQLSGGGYTTGWNDYLTYYTSTLTDKNDTSKDAEITDYLNNYTMAGRPYGHGYLGAAYLGYLASGQSEVSSANIAFGMNKIFEDIHNGAGFEDALFDNTGLHSADLEAKFANGDTDLVKFVRTLSYNAGDGAGSVITSSLSDGGTNIVGNSESSAPFSITNIQIDNSSGNSGGSGGGVGGTGGGLTSISLHVGSESNVFINVKLFQMNAEALGLESTNVTTMDEAKNAINDFKNAIGYISNVRGYYGAVQNRLEHTIANLDNVVENTTAAESAIRDTNMAKTMMEFSANNILQQAGQAMLAQTNQQPQAILQLLQ